MKILYASCLCSTTKYKELFENCQNKPGQQVQKYNRLMAEGLALNEGVELYTATVLPITSENRRKGIVNEKSETFNGVRYHYIKLLNLPIVKNLFSILSVFLAALLFFVKNKDSCLVADCLNQSAALGTVLASKVTGKRSVGIVTDLPDMLDIYSKTHKYINNFIITKFDSYVFLTEDMNTYLNKFNKHYVVIEGLVDNGMAVTNNTLLKKHSEKVCIYAGGLQRQYGIPYLVQAFVKLKIENAQLHVYGDGDFAEELASICMEHNNIKYFGVKLNDYVVNEQLMATLLINPRPSDEKFTKYSFPSKNMEYMVSGTPVLTTKLPGMPAEYYDYVYLIEDESIEGIAETLRNLFDKPEEELHVMGQKAKEFVLKEKNNIIQAEKIVKMIKNQVLGKR